MTRLFAVILSVFILLSSMTMTTRANPSFTWNPNAHVPVNAFSLEWPLSTTHATYAWALGATGLGQTILVIDTGLDSHMMQTVLKGQIAPSYTVPLLHTLVAVPCPPSTIPYTQPTGCTKTILQRSTTPYSDTLGHGSFVVCEIVCAGKAFNYYGIAPQAKVAIARVFSGSGGADPRDVASAIYWGIANHYHIMSMSLGSAFPAPEETAAVAAAIKAGIVIVAAAGNDGYIGPTYPGSEPGVLRVGATDAWNRHASFSNGGLDVAIAAPGFYMYGIAPSAVNQESCAGLCQWSGTSMATPLVAGAIADMVSLGLTYKQSVTSLLKGAHHWNNMNKIYYGSGVLDLQGAIVYARGKGWLK